MTLLQYRRLNEMTLNAISKKLGVEQSTICLIENGKRFPKPDLIHRIQVLTKNSVTAQDIFDNYKKLNKLK